MRKFIRYSPPKSQLWGHRCNRLSATQVLERGQRFLNEQTIVDQPLSIHTLSVLWPDGNDASFSQAMMRLAEILGPPSERFEGMGVQLATMNRQSWRLVESAQLPALAKWVDENNAAGRGKKAMVTASAAATFRWHPRYRDGGDEIPEALMLMLNLGTLRAVSTLFAFYSIEHYQRIKKYFSEIGLANLSDKHVRPKGLFS